MKAILFIQKKETKMNLKVDDVQNLIIKAFKNQKRFNPHSLAVKAGVDHAAVYRLLSGERRPKTQLSTALALFQTLKIPFSALDNVQPTDSLPRGTL